MLQASRADLGFVVLDRARDKPLHRQLYDALREAIFDGRLQAGMRLPSSRDLARRLDVSRTVIVNAYEQLDVEGYLDTRVGSGSFVSDIAGAGQLNAAGVTLAPSLSDRGSQLFSRGESFLESCGVFDRLGELSPFRPGIPALDAFPSKLWASTLSKSVREAGEADWSYGDPAGYEPLRRVVAEYVGASRGVRCTAEQIVIVSGTQQALYLIGQVLLDSGQKVWCGNPEHSKATNVLEGIGVGIEPVRIDEAGLDMDRVIESDVEAGMMYLTPSHQFPLGPVLSISRRLQAIKWAVNSGAWIFEDDYDSEFRYENDPIPAMQGLDDAGCVLYCGSFSRVMYPSLRLGYLIVPLSLVEPLTALKALMDRCSPVTTQMAMARFMSEGHFSRHIRRMRTLYRRRRDALIEMCGAEIGDVLTVQSSPAGMHLIGYLPDGTDDVAVSVGAARQGIAVPPLSRFYHAESSRPGLVLGYSAVPVHKMRTSVRQLGTAIRTVPGNA